MELTPKQQAIELIKRSNNILITTSEDNKGDGISSGLALTSILEKLGKQVNFVVYGDFYKRFIFLSGFEKIKKDFSGLKDFIISLSLENSEVGKVRYDIKEDKLNFFISPKQTNFKESDISFSYGGSKFDLVIVIDAVDLESLGSVYDENADFFYNQPVINIDHHSGNDHFGAVNLVDLTASSTGEILVSIIESLDPSLMDEKIATSLLTGIVSDTNSFQNSNTTPKSLTVTAQLIAAGADHELVVKNLFKTKSFKMLKIWGRILSNIKTDKENRMLWSVIKKEELGDVDSEKDIIKGVLDELLSTAPNIKIYLLFLKKEYSFKIFIRTARDIEAKQISYLFGGSGRGQEGEFEIKGSDFGSILEEVLEKIREYLSKINIKES